MNEKTKEQDNQNEARPSGGEGAHDRLLGDSFAPNSETIMKNIMKAYRQSDHLFEDMWRAIFKKFNIAMDTHKIVIPRSALDKFPKIPLAYKNRIIFVSEFINDRVLIVENRKIELDLSPIMPVQNFT